MKLSVANAGLNRPILLSGSRIEFLQSDGPRLPLGVKADINYKISTYDLKKDDLIFLTTDGIDEAENANRELFGVERLKNHILSITADHLSASEMKDSIIKEVQKFIKKNKPDDDMTVLVVKIK
jgi:sigma-B regulation protein RsbU (phosphoserine phosphatase)